MTGEQKAAWFAKLMSDGEQDQRNLWVFAGMEPIAHFDQSTQRWSVKTGRCNLCGGCCRIERLAFDWDEASGRCRYLKQEAKTDWICSLRMDRPFSCSIGDGQGSVAECTVRYSEV
jgi:hypothetical protein